MTPEGHELVTLAVRQTVEACAEVRAYQVRELAAAFDMTISTMTSRFSRAGAGSPLRIIRAVRVLVGAARCVELRQGGRYRHTIRLHEIVYPMGLPSGNVFNRYIRRADPPGYLASGLTPKGWLTAVDVFELADGYAAQLFPPQVWQSFDPIAAPSRAVAPLVVCESCNRPMYARRRA
jgi:AraC-like DNA-binding protein